uniref:AraC family transcriptional regulator n=1 Tax=Ascaris lumbricoides TaxID=6252 RepID=A0A0M3HUR1_ASCLU
MPVFKVSPERLKSIRSWARHKLGIDERCITDYSAAMLYSHVTLLMLRVVDVVAKTTVQQSARMLVADVPGDIQIGALFPLHHQIAGTEGCGQIWEQYGIQRTEIALSTIAELNNHLPFKLGISIRQVLFKPA